MNVNEIEWIVMVDFADILVAKTATVAELMQAVEAAFSHLPRKGAGKISWYMCS